MDPESGHSNGHGKKKERKVHDIPWSLKKLQMNHKKENIKRELVMPSKIPVKYKDALVYPSVMLDLHPNDEKAIYGLNIMRDSTSRNILHVRLILEGASLKGGRASRVIAWVEPFAGSLLDYLTSKNLGIPDFKEARSKIIFPTPILRTAITQVVHGMEDLITSGNYHGNFSLAGTYYVINETTSALQTKLCNFRKKNGGTYNKYVAEDWGAILAELKTIRETAKGLKTLFPNIDYSMLDGLIDVMKDINLTNAAVAFKGIKRQPFFWGKEERKSFFMYDIAIALNNSAFCSKVTNAESIVLPWGKPGSEGDFHGLLHLMNMYRQDNGEDEYDTKSRVDLVRCVTGLYTHEVQLKTKLMVDVAIKEDYPDLCYILYALLPGAKTLHA